MLWMGHAWKVTCGVGVVFSHIETLRDERRVMSDILVFLWTTHNDKQLTIKLTLISCFLNYGLRGTSALICCSICLLLLFFIYLFVIMYFLNYDIWRRWISLLSCQYQLIIMVVYWEGKNTYPARASWIRHEGICKERVVEQTGTTKHQILAHGVLYSLSPK